VAKEGSRETGLRDEIEHLARGHDGLGCHDALLREPIDLPGERLDLRDLLGAGRADHSLILLKNTPFILRSASCVQWVCVPPLYMSTRFEARHPSYRSQDERRSG